MAKSKAHAADPEELTPEKRAEVERKMLADLERMADVEPTVDSSLPVPDGGNEPGVEGPSVSQSIKESPPPPEADSSSTYTVKE